MHEPEAFAERRDGAEEEALADSVGLALLVVLETLTPAERVAFVLHDMFDLPFDEVAPIVGRSSRRRGSSRAAPAAGSRERNRPHRIATATVSARLSAPFSPPRAVETSKALLAVLDPDVVFRADPTAVAMGGPAEIRGAAGVASTFIRQRTGCTTGAHSATDDRN